MYALQFRRKLHYFEELLPGSVDIPLHALRFPWFRKAARITNGRISDAAILCPERESNHESDIRM
jgi:hypothetical protein